MLPNEMATHSSVLAWRIPEMGEPGGLPSMGSYRVGHDWSNLAAAAAVLPNKFLSYLKSHFNVFIFHNNNKKNQNANVCCMLISHSETKFHCINDFQFSSSSFPRQMEKSPSWNLELNSQRIVSLLSDVKCKSLNK